MKTLVTRICLLLAVTLVTLSSTAQAQVVPLIFSVEGPITGIDPAAGTITASGVTVTIPATVPLVGTRGLTGANLAQLLDAAAPGRVRSIFASAGENPGYSGGTLKANGIIVETTAGRVYQVTAAVVEMAENVLVGPLVSVDMANHTFVVNGATCRMNTDERFPADVLDVGLAPSLTFNDLNGAIGTIVSVVGYFHAGAVHAVTVETELLPNTPNTDTVRIVKADGKNVANNRSELRVLGSVSPFDPTATITIIDVTTGRNLGTVAVAAGAIPGQGDFQLRRRNLATTPTRIRATSSNGGTHELDVTVR